MIVGARATCKELLRNARGLWRKRSTRRRRRIALESKRFSESGQGMPVRGVNDCDATAGDTELGTSYILSGDLDCRGDARVAGRNAMPNAFTEKLAKGQTTVQIDEAAPRKWTFCWAASLLWISAPRACALRLGALISTELASTPGNDACSGAGRVSMPGNALRRPARRVSQIDNPILRAPGELIVPVT